MRLDTIHKTVNGKKYTSHLLRLAYRDNGRVRHCTIANLSSCSDEEIEAIRLALKHKGDLTKVASLKENLVLKQGLSVGAVFALLSVAKRLGIDRNTVVFFTSDNGPHREGGNNPEFFDSNGKFRGIKRALYEGGIRVPTIVRWPGRIAAGSTSPVIGSFADVLPTLAEMVVDHAQHDGPVSEVEAIIADDYPNNVY